MLIMVGMVFAPGMPLMLPFTFLAVVARYFYSKYLFLYWSKTPKPIDSFLNSYATNFLFLVLTGYFLNAVWAFGN